MKSLYSIAENAYNNVLIFSTFYFLYITFLIQINVVTVINI